jgi:hypothetical protein
MTPNKRLERALPLAASIRSCVGEPLNRSINVSAASE